MDNTVNASNMRAISDKVRREATTQLFAMIEKAAREGKDHVEIATGLMQPVPDVQTVIQELQARGFEAEFISDQREGDYYAIKW